MLFHNLTDLSGRGKSVELKKQQQKKQTNNNKKEHVIYISPLDTVGDDKSEIGKTAW